MNYLIPNGTSLKNIGDQAILMSLVGLIRSTDKNGKIVLHSTDADLYDSQEFKHVFETLYSYAVLTKKDFFTRIVRLSTVVIFYFLFRFKLHRFLSFLKSHPLYQTYLDYISADVIIGAGGGYLRSKTGFTQTLNFLMQIFMLHVSTVLGKRKLVAPISFGPFAYVWQEKLAAETLAQFDLVAIRESVSYELLKKYRLTNMVKSCDLAMLLPKKVRNSKIAPTIGFTIINWYPQKDQQKQLEKVYAQALEKLTKHTKLIIQPIIQVANPVFKTENDTNTTHQVCKLLIKKGVQVKTPIMLKNLSHAQTIYGNLTLLLGMRMHSNILAAISGVPFVAVAYEHKTVGVARALKITNYLDVENINAPLLYKKLKNAYTNQYSIKKSLIQQIDSIKLKEFPYLRTIIN